MGLTHQTLEELAPDQASLGAARALLDRRRWPTLAVEGELLWGLCQGSGATPYRAVFDGQERGFKCTCPSRKQPCKHVLALLWLALDTPDAFGAPKPFEVPASSARPDWVDEWLGRRRKGSAAKGAAEPSAPDLPRPTPSLDAAREVDSASASAQASASAEGASRARERNRERREAETLAGLAELDRWLGDLFARGLAASTNGLAATVQPITRRLADAKAAALANRVAELPSLVAAAPEGAREEALLHGLGELHVITEAYQRAAELPAALRADVRAAVGWTVTRDDVERDPAALRQSGVFDVVAVRDEPQVDGLRRLETWLVRRELAAPAAGAEGPGAGGELPRVGLLLDYVPASSRGATGGLGVGEAVAGTLVHYPSAAPQRALFDASGARPVAGGPLPRAGASLSEALDSLDEARARLPWLGAGALFADGCVVRMALDGSLWLTDEAASAALPIPSERHAEVFVLLGLPAFTVFGIVERGAVTLHRAATSLGEWSAA